ncbi:HAD-IA family hydrolase [Altererythrobacter xixiisoli]|uniref:phosphoglycolate phosphatase n=1 Tax=Croceibacterium xixiisoli TaxID=1476466 RepID=A0A6I4TU68_9SPHN|nr:HAD-IA family hydrolase [Croceibacterium xixiisoli]
MRLAVFDCDGTLSDGQAAVCLAMERAFAVAGLPAPARCDIRRSVGLSLPQAIARLGPDLAVEQHTNLVDAYKQAFRAARSDGSLHEPLYDGIPALLTDLRQSGWQLGVATGKSDRGLKSTLATHGLLDLFVTLQTADRHPSKPDPAMLEAAMSDAFAQPGNTVMIGDTVYDIAMARTAGARAIGVSWGYHAPEELIAAGAEAVAETPEQLKELIHG